MNPASNARRAKERQLIGAIDQGTSSTRFLVFENKTGQLVSSSQIEIKRIVPKEGWVEIDPNTIMNSVYQTIDNVSKELSLESSELIKLECIGICNQRESTVVWDSKTGEALYNVIVWMDNRTKDIVDQMIDSVPGRDFNWLKDKTGLPMSTYFSAFKLKWLIENVLKVKEALRDKRLLFGTVDSWILWNLTGRHLTDVTNASRTFLMDIETLDWDKSLCKHFNVPLEILPKILSSADDFGTILHGPLRGLPITGVIGDQSAALFGHNCLQVGQTKATFGTGCFIMQNIGSGPLKGALSGVQRIAKRGLITTVGYKLKGKPACYALEGSIKIAGAALHWLRDNMQLIKNFEECDELINSTTNAAGVFFVPALGGLYSPYWDPNAAGLFIGLSQFSRREHLVRATFDSIAYQTNDILSIMRGVTNGLMIDGGLCKSDNMCQILADITGCDIVRPSMCETSALGAAMVAGCGAGIWSYESMLANSNTPYEYSSSSNQKHHYPHESLHYEEKFSSLIASKTSRSSIATAANPSGGVPVIDAGGGGVNDDAGGGGSSSSIGLVADFDEDVEDVTTSGEFTSNSSSDDIICQRELAAVLRPSAHEDINDEDEDCVDAKVLENIGCESVKARGVTGSGGLLYYPPATASSGYASCADNLEATTTNSTTSSQSSTALAKRIQQHLIQRRQLDSPGLDSQPSRLINLNGFLETSPSISEQQNEQQLDEELDDFQPDPTELSVQTTVEEQHPAAKQVHVFQSYISLEHRQELVATWRLAVERSMAWTKIHHEEVRRIDYQRLSSLPISMFLFFSIGMFALSGLIRSRVI